MKTSLLILAIMACACVVYARPDGEANDNKKIMINLDKLTNELRSEFADEKFLEDKFGNPSSCDQNRFSSDGKESWMNKIPWGTLIDIIVQAVKKATE